MENVIVVTVNYRLHVLGFMTFPSKGISGNAALKDQQMALEWVHENIANFNGDPNNICLFGESGGACNTHFHVLNPKSRRLIKSAICQSGTALNSWVIFGHTEQTSKSLAKILGCKSDSTEDAYKTLMSASTRDLYDNCDKIVTSKDTRNGIKNMWRMIIEDESEEAFITKSSIDSLITQAGQINIPMMFGTNDGDGFPTLGGILARSSLEVFNDNLDFIIPRELKSKSTEKTEKLVNQIRQFYLNGRDLSKETMKEFVLISTDVDYLIAQTVTNELNVKYQPGCKQFLYEFQFDGQLNMMKKLVKLEHVPLAAHADDVFYLFGGKKVDEVQLGENSREAMIRKIMCKLWTNFAKNGDPTPDRENPLNFKWTSVDPTLDRETGKVNLDYLIINDDLKMVRNLNKDRMDFWRNIYNDMGKDSWSLKPKM